MARVQNIAYLRILTKAKKYTRSKLVERVLDSRFHLCVDCGRTGDDFMYQTFPLLFHCYITKAKHLQGHTEVRAL